MTRARSQQQVLDGLTQPTEKQFEHQVRHLAQLFNWRYYHPYLSIHSPRGWPDIALCRPPRLILAELKSAKGVVSVDQQAWLDELGECPGVEVYLWRPDQLEEIKEILR